MSVGRLEGDRLVVKEVARLPNAPVRLPDGIHWDLLALHQGMLEALGRLHRELDEGALWVGVDSWGVDYGLLDVEGRLLGPPFHYRDERTTGLLDELDGLVGLRRIYDATGTQAMAINTICQLLTERGKTAYGAASHLLMVPDLFAYLLTGERRLERTIGSTTELMDARSGQLVDWLFPVLGLRRDLFPPAIEPGEHYGPVLPEVAASVGMRTGADGRGRRLPRHGLGGTGRPCPEGGFRLRVQRHVVTGRPRARCPGDHRGQPPGQFLQRARLRGHGPLPQKRNGLLDDPGKRAVLGASGATGRPR